MVHIPAHKLGSDNKNGFLKTGVNLSNLVVGFFVCLVGCFCCCLPVLGGVVSFL